MTKFTTRPSSDLRDHYEEMLKLLDTYDYVVFTEEGAKDVVMISMETHAIYQNLLLQQRILNRKHESTTIITVDLDSKLVKDAEELLFEMGLDIETFIVMSLKAVVREGRIPFDYKDLL